ncbi:MAG: hypothetical protein GXO60_10050 [Epsilonproteobacteria bacterium]|nr:hypothetical protein [Campylobacterota bacterium]
MNEHIHKKLASILENSHSKKIDYHDIVLYLINKETLDKVLSLELQVRMDNEEKGIKKRNHFYEYAKIINPDFPAFKYTLSMKHKKKEIFDPQKVQKALPAEFEIWKNKSRVDLEKKIKDPESAITEEQAKKLREELEQEIVISEQNIKKVIENFHDYDVVISTFEYYTYYPALYFVVDDGKKNRASDTHLRQDVPNLLWFEDNRPFSELRSNDRMSRIIQTFDRYCGSIYIKEKSK